MADVKIELLEGLLREDKGATNPRQFGRTLASACTAGLADGNVAPGEAGRLPETQLQDTQLTLGTCGSDFPSDDDLIKALRLFARF
ncbi:unnamed protein product, partial [Symbiodinium sp. CCMP2592]